MNDHYSKMAAESIRMCMAEFVQAMTRPSIIYRPTITKCGCEDGRNFYWQANYCDVVGVGGSPEEAMTNFDLAWRRLVNPQHSAST